MVNHVVSHMWNCIDSEVRSSKKVKGSSGVVNIPECSCSANPCVSTDQPSAKSSRSKKSMAIESRTESTPLRVGTGDRENASGSKWWRRDKQSLSKTRSAVSTAASVSSEISRNKKIVGGGSVSRKIRIMRSRSGSNESRKGRTQRTQHHNRDAILGTEIVPVKQQSNKKFSFLSQIDDKRALKLVHNHFGSVDQLQMVVDEFPTIPAQPDHVVIKVKASTVSIEDCLCRKGIDFDVFNPMTLPIVPGKDIVGTIVACGSAASHFKVGERVAALCKQGGGNGRYASVPSDSLISIPRAVGFNDAACMLSFYATAYQALRLLDNEDKVFSMKKKKVLVVGGLDATGQALIQMCIKAKAEVFTTAPHNRHGYVRNILKAVPLSEHSDSWCQEVAGQMDVVFDGVGKDSLLSSALALKDDGELVCFGNSNLLTQDMGLLGAPISAHIDRLISRVWNRTKVLDLWEFAATDPETYKKTINALFQLVRWNKLKPHIVKKVTLAEVATAQEEIESGCLQGAVVCMPWKTSE